MLQKNIFIIGNGFDLDLGLKTSYSDFAKSSFWPQQEGYTIPYMKTFLEKKREAETWFDIEKSLTDYAQKTNCNILSFIRKWRYNSQVDKNYFDKIKDALCSYIKEQQEGDIKKSSVAEVVLKSVISNGFFDSIYSFNYTDLNVLAKKIGINSEIKYNHIHGKISNKSIILGVNDTPIKNGYEFLQKNKSEYYRSHSIPDDLNKAKEVVFFGLSLPGIDYVYFEKFFKSQSEKGPLEDMKKKNITIFTKDENSRLNIINGLEKMGVNLHNINAHSNFKIIRTIEEKDKCIIEEFYDRLSKNSKAIIGPLISDFEFLQDLND